MKAYNKIVVLGGASALWTPENIARMAKSSSVKSAEVILVDIALDRAREMAELCNLMIARAYPGTGLRVSAAPDLDQALPEAEAVISCYCNQGQQIEHRLNALSRKYGSEQASYTSGPGAMLYVATQAAPMIALAKAMLHHCPDATLINCSNPLPAVCRLAVLAGLNPRKVLGFCGALTWERKILADFLGVSGDRLAFRIGGTNHCTFLTEILLDGQDAYPLVRERAKELGYLDMGCWGRMTTEIKLLEATGYLVPGGHPSDIFPTIHGEWMPPGPDAPPRPASFGANFLESLQKYVAGDDTAWNPPADREVPISWLDALAGDTSEQRFSINVTNGGAVPNMPDWAVLDLECHLDQRGVSPLGCPPLPNVIAEVARRHHVCFDLAARAALSRDHSLLVQAIQLLPFADYMLSAEQIIADAREEIGEELIF